MQRIGFGWNIGDGIPQRNTRKFDIFDRRTSNFSNRLTLWHGAEKSESENPGGDNIFKNAGHENNFDVENLGCVNSIIWNHVSSNQTNTDSSHANLNQLIHANLTTINNSDEICALQQILSCDKYFTDAAASKFSKIIPLALLL